MNEEPTARHFKPGRHLLSRTAKAELWEKGYLHLETEEDDLELCEQEALRLADFLRDSQEDALVATKLISLAEYVQRGEAKPRVAQTVLVELLVQFVPTPLVSYVKAVLEAIGAEQEEEIP
jgi:predicted DNA-binding protein (UPF0251 family)